MERIDWLEFYKERYYKELERRAQFSDKFNILLTIITISGGGYLLILDKLFKVLEMNNYQINGWTGVLIFMSTIIFILYDIIFYNMFNIYFENEYQQLSASGDIEKKRKELIEYYDKYYDEYYKSTGKSKEILVDQDMQEDLKEKYIEAFDFNNRQNNTRMKNNVRLNKYIAVITSLIILTYIIALAIPYDETIIIRNEEPITFTERSE